MASPTKFFTIVLLACATLSANAFVTPSKCISSVPSVTTAQQPSTTALSERQWNFNEGQGPWGMKKNAETWNGRVAQMAFVWIFLQELVTGKGVIQGINEGNLFFLANAGLFGVTLLGLTAWLAIKGENDYTKD